MSEQRNLKVFCPLIQNYSSMPFFRSKTFYCHKWIHQPVLSNTKPLTSVQLFIIYAGATVPFSPLYLFIIHEWRKTDFLDPMEIHTEKTRFCLHAESFFRLTLFGVQFTPRCFSSLTAINKQIYPAFCNVEKVVNTHSKFRLHGAIAMVKKMKRKMPSNLTPSSHN